jgi:DNA-binding response OmpR family regulator
LPDQSGFDVCRTLQTDAATAHIPVVFLTAASSADALSKAFETGGHDFLAKPFKIGELAARLGARLRQKYAEDLLRERRSRFSMSVPRHEDAR